MKIVTNGVFDCLHYGHIILLQQVATYGPFVVGLNTDASVRRLKGDSRPIQDFDTRREAILTKFPKAIVVPIEDSDAFILAEQPDLIVRGWDQTISEVDEQFRVIRLPRSGEISTTAYVENRTVQGSLPTSVWSK